MSALGGFHAWWNKPESRFLKDMLRARLEKCQEDALKFARDPSAFHDKLVEAHVAASIYKELLDDAPKTGLVAQVVKHQEKQEK